ncbi:MAG: DUF192 domain-containing protein [Roseovarius sp.]
MGKRGHTLKLITLCGALLSALPVWAETCRDDEVHLRGDWGQARFSVEVADTHETRAQGLMHVMEMPRASGMLFVYPFPREVGFWMKNTFIPLDMIFVDETGMVRKVHQNAIPHDERPIMGGEDILVVLEINGGLSAQMGIVAGAQMRHPSFDAATAVWPCE